MQNVLIDLSLRIRSQIILNDRIEEIRLNDFLNKRKFVPVLPSTVIRYTQLIVGTEVDN
jgi:hypothetical protein